MKIIGVDSGLTGALAYVSRKDDSFVGTVIDMPLKHVNSRDIIDTELIAAVIHGEWMDADAIIVEPPQWRGGMSSKAMATSFFNYGRLTAAFPRWAEVHPSVWKKDLGLSKDKKESIGLAKELFPKCRSMLSRVKDHGRAEALLIAVWFIREFE